MGLGEQLEREQTGDIRPESGRDGEMKPRTKTCVNTDCHYNDETYPLNCSKEPQELRCCTGYRTDDHPHLDGMVGAGWKGELECIATRVKDRLSLMLSESNLYDMKDIERAVDAIIKTELDPAIKDAQTVAAREEYFHEDGDKPGCWTPTSRCAIPVRGCPGQGCVFNDVVSLKQCVEELKAWKMAEEQGLIDAGEELQHIRLKPLLDAACTFLSGDGMGAEVVHPAAEEYMTRLDVPTPTWAELCDAVDRYRARNVKVFRLNDYEWYAAETLESATAEAIRMTGVSPEEAADEFAHELTEEEMDRLVFYDNMEDQEASETRTFREQLDELIESGTEFPTYFAGTEA